MNKLFLLLLINVLWLYSCQKPVSAKTDGTNASIIGFSADKCACCWGYKIKIDNDPTIFPALYSNKGYWLTESFPEGYNIPFDAAFPIRVYIEWKADNTRCPYTFINISKMTIPQDYVKP